MLPYQDTTFGPSAAADLPAPAPAPDRVAALEGGKLISTVRRQPMGIEVEAIMQTSPRRVFDLLTDYGQLPQQIFGLESARTLKRVDPVSIVEFTMKLPFPVGRVRWTNAIRTWQQGCLHVIEWNLIDGDLARNDGRLALRSHRDQPNRTYAHYTVSVESRTRLPKAAERLATRWLVPKIVGKLRRVAEAS